MANPFYLQEIAVEAALCDRETELEELQSYAEAKANVLIFSPWRYGKTSLVKRVQSRLAEKGAVVVHRSSSRVAKKISGLATGMSATA
jgi:uncharacterized protein